MQQKPKSSSVTDDADNPEWTSADFARARPAGELPADLLAAFPKTKARVGRPAGSNRQQVTLRIPRDVIEHFKSGGPGWQTRAIAVLERAARRKA
jgi:uncharacterized protein (DUF4415 family)